MVKTDYTKWAAGLNRPQTHQSCAPAVPAALPLTVFTMIRVKIVHLLVIYFLYVYIFKKEKWRNVYSHPKLHFKQNSVSSKKQNSAESIFFPHREH